MATKKQISFELPAEALRGEMQGVEDAETLAAMLCRYRRLMDEAAAEKKKAAERDRNIRGGLFETLRGIPALKGPAYLCDAIEELTGILQKLDDVDREIRTIREEKKVDVESAQAAFDAIITEALPSDANDAARLRKLQHVELAYQERAEALAGLIEALKEPREVAKLLKKQLSDKLVELEQTSMVVDGAALFQRGK